jgi:hypothetical protein
MIDKTDRKIIELLKVNSKTSFAENKQKSCPFSIFSAGKNQ